MATPTLDQLYKAVSDYATKPWLSSTRLEEIAAVVKASAGFNDPALEKPAPFAATLPRDFSVECYMTPPKNTAPFSDWVGWVKRSV